MLYIRTSTSCRIDLKISLMIDNLANGDVQKLQSSIMIEMKNSANRHIRRECNYSKRGVPVEVLDLTEPANSIKTSVG